MCRGFQQNERARLLKIKAFDLQLSISKSSRKPLPDSLTLYYLPRINGSPLEINDSKIRSDSPAFVTLHRLVSSASSGHVLFFGSRERVMASEGVRFEVYMRDEKVLKGIFRKKEEGEMWRMECVCGIESEAVAAEVRSAEVSVAAEGGVEMREKVEMVVVRRRKRCFRGLEEIPEVEIEGESDDYCCCCNCGREVEELDVGDGSSSEEEEVEREVEGVKWAVDVGIWVMCLGVGYLVSKASSNTLIRRRRRIL